MLLLQKKAAQFFIFLFVLSLNRGSLPCYFSELISIEFLEARSFSVKFKQASSKYYLTLGQILKVPELPIQSRKPHRLRLQFFNLIVHNTWTMTSSSKIQIFHTTSLTTLPPINRMNCFIRTNSTITESKIISSKRLSLYSCSLQINSPKEPIAEFFATSMYIILNKATSSITKQLIKIRISHIVNARTLRTPMH